MGTVSGRASAGFPPRCLLPVRPRGLQPQAALAKPAGIDLDATYISRTPLYSQYCLDYSIDGLPRPCAGTEDAKRWPDRGEIVTFTAHFMNKGTLDSGPFAYSWSIDGQEMARGSSPGLAPGAEGTAIYLWAWDHDVVNGRLIGQHTVRFALDPDDQVVETYKSNNAIEDRTDATPLGFQMPADVYAALEVPVDPKWPFSAEDWVQKQFAAMNAAFAQSTFASAPDGCEERIRLDQFRITPEAVDNDGGIGGWFYAWDDRAPGGYYNADIDVSGGLLHELGHQLGLVDLYTMDIPYYDPVPALDRNGRPALMVFSSTYRLGLMNDPGLDPPSFDEQSVGGLNTDKGYRRGYYGEYEFDTPAATRIHVVDNRGQPASGVTLKFYRRPQEDLFQAYGAAPALTAETGPDGVATLPNLPVGTSITTLTGHTLADNPFGRIDAGGNLVYMVEIDKGTHQEYAWLDITQLNLLDWQGGSTIELASHVPPDDAPAPPTSLGGIVQRGQAILTWAPNPALGVVGYYVYKTLGPRNVFTQLSASRPGAGFADVLSDWTAGYAVTAVDSAGRESGFSEIFWAMRPDNPTGLAIGADGQRYVTCDAGVVLQGADGRYLRLASLAPCQFGRIAIDAAGRLVASEPSCDKFAIIDPTADPTAPPESEIGGTGTGPGQFSYPAGVASWGDRWSWGGPYSLDGSTILLCHFDGTLNSEEGIPGQPDGALLVDGRFGQGVSLQGGATLAYPVGAALTLAEGAIEFWLKPSWDGDDGQVYRLVEAGVPGGNGVRIEKYAANALRFQAWRDSVETGVGVDVSSWKAGDWHHVGVVWSGSWLDLYVDGAHADHTDSAQLPADFGQVVALGPETDRTQQANAVFDEFRISSTARLGDSDTAGRILVVDSLNDRLQAFDVLGNFVASFGTPGTGPGQFQSPQGLACDGHSRVVVADSGNGRLQVLSFDGTVFSFVREIDGGLMNPEGVALSDDWIVVADSERSQVLVFAENGDLLAAFNSPNDGAYFGSFFGPRDVAVDQAGRIVVVDSGNERVVEIVDWEPRPVRRHISMGH
jgi:hypothetical protein